MKDDVSTKLIYQTWTAKVAYRAQSLADNDQNLTIKIEKQMWFYWNF